MNNKSKKKLRKTNKEEYFKHLLRQVGEASGLSLEEMEKRFDELIQRSIPSTISFIEEKAIQRTKKISPYKLTTTIDPRIKPVYDEWNKKHRKDGKSIPKFISQLLLILLSDAENTTKEMEILNLLRSYHFI